MEDELLLQVGNGLLKEWKLEHLLITLGEQGMILFDHDHPPYHAPSRAREVYDVSGAGDTAIALFTLAMISGATPIEAAEISNHASSVVVAKLGTATLTPEELLNSFRLNNGEVGPIVPIDALCVAEPLKTLTSPPKSQTHECGALFLDFQHQGVIGICRKIPCKDFLCITGFCDHVYSL